MENYTAEIYFNDQQIIAAQGENLTRLTATLLHLLDSQPNGASGMIRANSGEIVQQFRKVALE